MTENEFILIDRIQKIKSINEKYDLLNNAYLSFSGGRDSMVLHYLIDEALPGNKIPRVFINTGIEYKSITGYVKNLSENDNRVFIIEPSKNIKEILNTYGFPFKSKEHSKLWECWKRGNKSKWVTNYLNDGTRFTCPKVLRYQFEPDFKLNLSDKCCYKLKKEPAHKWEKENNRPIAIIGIRQDEGGQRANYTNCAVFDGDSLKKFKPLNPISDAWENWYIQKRNIKLCELYYPPFNFNRTGGKGCPFSLDLEKQLYTMRLLLPAEQKQCETIWQPVYSEYRRLGYRLHKETGQKELF